MSEVMDLLARKFVCPKCKERGGHVERLALSGTGITRWFDFQPYRYAFVSCEVCGYTEIFNLRMLGEKDDLGMFLDVLFSN